MPTQIITFDNVDLSEYFSTWQESNPSRLNAMTAPRRHGAILNEAVVEDARRINIKGTIMKASAELLRNTIDDLSELFMRRNCRLQLWDDRFRYAYKSEFTFAYIIGSAMKAVDFELQFFCPDPFWYSVTPVTEPWTLSTSDTPIDITDNKWRRAFTLTNTGKIYTVPKITVTATGGVGLTTVIVRNLTQGLYWIYSGNVAASKSLVVNAIDFTVRNDGNDDLTNWNGDFLVLRPGANSMEIEGSTPATYTFEWTPRWA
jgi:phage-related protein